MNPSAVQLPLLRPKRLDPLPISSGHYVAALQNKAGERDALQNVSPDVWERMTPLIHFVGPKSRNEPFRAGTVRGWVGQLRHVIGEHPAYLDVTRLDPMFPVATKDGRSPVLKYIFETGRSRGLRFVPVVWVGESADAHRRVVQNAALQDGHGVALRYRMLKYVPPLGTSIGKCVENELVGVGCEAKDADLIIDLEFIDPDDELDANDMAASLNEMVGIGDWRSVVILGTSIPTMMSCVSEGTVGSVPRREWTLWSQLQDCALNRMPAFGDYAIQNPRPPHDGGGPGMRANIRYTANGETLVARGHGPLYEEGNDQYRQLCQELVARNEFAGRAFSWGDEVIDNCATGVTDPGGQRVWRGAGTSHHLRVVSQQLAAQRPA